MKSSTNNNKSTYHGFSVHSHTIIRNRNQILIHNPSKIHFQNENFEVDVCCCLKLLVMKDFVKRRINFTIMLKSYHDNQGKTCGSVLYNTFERDA